MGVPCRCGKCRTRKTLSKHPREYVREEATACECGGQFAPDKYRIAQEHKKTKCGCDGPKGEKGSFPHRKGGSVWCKHHPTGPNKQEYEARYGPGSYDVDDRVSSSHSDDRCDTERLEFSLEASASTPCTSIHPPF